MVATVRVEVDMKVKPNLRTRWGIPAQLPPAGEAVARSVAVSSLPSPRSVAAGRSGRRPSKPPPYRRFGLLAWGRCPGLFTPDSSQVGASRSPRGRHFHVLHVLHVLPRDRRLPGRHFHLIPPNPTPVHVALGLVASKSSAGRLGVVPGLFVWGRRLRLRAARPAGDQACWRRDPLAMRSAGDDRTPPYSRAFHVMPAC